MSLRVAQGSGSSGKSGGGSGRVAREDPNSLQSNSIVRVINLVSVGPCVGLVDADKSIFIDKTALMASDDSYNFSGISWEQRTGEATQDYLTGFTALASTETVNVDVLKATPVIRTVAGPIDAVRIVVGLPNLAYQSPTTGDLTKTTVSFKLSKRVNGTSTWTDSVVHTYTDKCVSLFQEGFRIELGGTDDWDLKFERTTDDSTESNLQNKTQWSYTTLLTDGKFQFPYCGLVGMTISAKQFGSNQPVVGFDWYGLIVNIPSNYDPATRVYTGVWDGTFTTGWTDNPVWLLYGFLTNKEWGLGEQISEADVDRYSLYAIAQYCDEMVDDGFGGKEPRFTFNYQFTNSTDAYAMLQSIAASFRGYVYYAAGSIGAFCDMPGDSVMSFSPSNVIGGDFVYEGTGLSARHSVVLVTWFDPDNFCEQAVEVVDDPDSLDLYGWRELSVTAIGCTSRGQANRFGKWILDTEKYATQTVSFKVAWDGASLSVGDIIDVCDPVYSTVRFGGRVSSYIPSATELTIDEPVNLDNGAPFVLSVMTKSGLFENKTLTNSGGTTDVLTFATALSGEIVDGASWKLSSSIVAPRQFRVMGISEQEPGVYAITGLIYDPTKYARVEDGIILEPISYTRYGKEPPKPPTAIDYSEYMYKYDFGLRSALSVTVTPNSDSSMTRGYEIQVQPVDGVWISSGEVLGTSADFREIEAGGYNIRARAIDILGNAGAWSATKYAILFGSAAPPGDVDDFVLHVVGDNSFLSWTANTDLDFSHYTIRFSALTTGATWEASSLIRNNITSTDIQVPTQIGTFLIKAVDLSGTESTNATLIANTIDSITKLETDVAISDYPSWSGTKTDCEVSGTTLVMSTGETLATYDMTLSGSGYYDLGEIYNCRISSFLDAYAADLSATWGTLGTWGSLGTWALSGSTDWSVKVYVSLTSDDPSGTPTWSDYTELMVSDYTLRAFKIRIAMTRTVLTITPVIGDLTLSLLMPNRTIGDKNITSSTGGTAITFDPVFRHLFSVGITAQDMATGDYFEYTSAPDVDGFTIRFKNASGTAISRTFDYIAVGYGSMST